MIYINTGQVNQIVTDSWLNYIPSSILIYFDDILIGTYTNQSTFNQYIVVDIPSEDLPSTLTCKRYKMKIYKDLSLLKIETICVVLPHDFSIKSIENKTTIKTP